MHISQWRIQDIPEEGAPTPHGAGANIRFYQIFWMKLKEFGPGGRGARTLRPP